MDEADYAAKREEEERAALIEAAQAASIEADPTGECLNCGEVLAGDQRFCSRDCRDDWQRRRDGEKRRGRFMSWEG